MAAQNPSSSDPGPRALVSRAAISRAPVSLSLKSVAVDRGGRRVLTNVNLIVGHEARLAVVGANGVGKTTLLAVMAGRLPPADGQVSVNPPTVTVGLLDQEPQRSPTETGRQLIARRTGVAAAQAEFEAASTALATDSPGVDDRYSAALARWQQLGGFELEVTVERLADEVGLPVDVLSRPTATLSGGQLTRVRLIAIMASRFGVALLDEPTNNLDGHGLDMLERWMGEYQGPIVYVSHDRRFLEATALSVARLEEHRDGIEVFNGGWLDYEQLAATARRQAEQRFQEYTTERSRLEQVAQRRREWADRGISRTKKRPADNDRNRRSYELNSAANQMGAAKKISDRLNRLEKVDKPWQQWELRLSIAESDRGSSEVVVLDRVVVERGEFRLGPISEVVAAGERLAIDGPNGSGKTTLVDVILGQMPPTSGTITRGPSVRFGVIGQSRTRFTGESRTEFTGQPKVDGALLGQFSEASGLTDSDARSLLAKFGVDAEALTRGVETLSPGQRTRAELALFQVTGVNAIVLDEPTNHLDMPAIEQLERALATFSGTLIVVSHDRRFRQELEVERTLRLG